MNDNPKVVLLPSKSKEDISPDTILEICKGRLEKCWVIGVTPDGKSFLASSSGDQKELLWQLSCLKFDLLNSDLESDYEDDEV